MLVTTILLYRVAVERWRWPPAAAIFMIVVFGTVDATFLASNSLKIVEGGWFPITVGAFMVGLMLCWRQGASLTRLACKKCRCRSRASLAISTRWWWRGPRAWACG
jgi:KUP system potassium uptake protein